MLSIEHSCLFLQTCCICDSFLMSTLAILSKFTAYYLNSFQHFVSYMDVVGCSSGIDVVFRLPCVWCYSNPMIFRHNPGAEMRMVILYFAGVCKLVCEENPSRLVILILSWKVWSLPLLFECFITLGCICTVSNKYFIMLMRAILLLIKTLLSHTTEMLKWYALQSCLGGYFAWGDFTFHSPMP